MDLYSFLFYRVQYIALFITKINSKFTLMVTESDTYVYKRLCKSVLSTVLALCLCGLH